MRVRRDCYRALSDPRADKAEREPLAIFGERTRSVRGGPIAQIETPPLFDDNLAVEKSGSAELLKIVAAASRSRENCARSSAAPGRFRFRTSSNRRSPFSPPLSPAKLTKRFGFFCPSVHSQETLYESLLNWQPGALFLPEAEFAAVENILPDPEIAAERLALLTKIERQPGPHLIVATRAGLDQPAPERGALVSATLPLQRGSRTAMEAVINSLGEAQYERVAQVTTRGQFAVRGGILTFIPGRRKITRECRIFADEIESLREFDLDTQTSVRNLQSVDILVGATSPQEGTASTFSPQGAGASRPPGVTGPRPSLMEDSDGHICDYIDNDHLKIAIEPEEDNNAEIRISEGWIETGPEDFSGVFEDSAIGEFAIKRFHHCRSKTWTIHHALKGMARSWRAHRHLFSNRRRDRTFSRNHRRGKPPGCRIRGRNAASRVLFSGWKSYCPFRCRIVRPVSGTRPTAAAAGGASRPQSRAD